MLEYLLTWTDDALGQTHLAFALVALLAGVGVFVLRKGTLRHRVIGGVYVVSMLMLNGSALMKYDLTGGPNLFHFFAVTSLLTLGAAMLAIYAFKRRRNVGALYVHGEVMIWSYYGLVMALIAEVLTRSYPHLLHGEGGWGRFVMVIGPLMAIAAWGTRRFIRWEMARTVP